MKKKTPIQTNNLVGASVEDLEKENHFLNVLTTLAHEVPQKVTSINKNRSSRFWFKVETTNQLVTANKDIMKPRSLEHVDSEVTTRLDTYKEEMPASLKEKITQVREFFLTEIAPITLAAGGGASQAKEVAERLLEIEVDSALFTRFDNMINRAATLKLSQFVANLFGLPAEAAHSLLGAQMNAGSDHSQINSILNYLKANDEAFSKKDLVKLQQDISKIEKVVSNEKR